MNLAVIAWRVARTSARNKGLYKSLHKKYPNVPEYVLDQIYNGISTEKIGQSAQFESILREYDKRKWKKGSVTLHWDKLNRITQNNIKRRKFGIENPDSVPDDAERLARQMKVVPGENEPVIFLETSGGLELVEGYHRTMALLMSGSDDLESDLTELAKASDREIDEIAKSWKPVQAKAWIGFGGSDDADIELPEGDSF